MRHRSSRHCCVVDQAEIWSIQGGQACGQNTICLALGNAQSTYPLRAVAQQHLFFLGPTGLPSFCQLAALASLLWTPLTRLLESVELPTSVHVLAYAAGPVSSLTARILALLHAQATVSRFTSWLEAGRGDGAPRLRH